MKRFAKSISLAACLVFLCGATAMAQGDAVVVESKIVAPSSNGNTIGVFISNTQDATGLVLPLEIRNISGTAFISPNHDGNEAPPWNNTTDFTRGLTPGGRMDASPLGSAGAFWPASNPTANRYPAEDGAPCGGTTYTTSSGPSDPGLYISPDAILHATVSTGSEGNGDSIVMQPGFDPPGTPAYSTPSGSPSYRFIVNVNAGPGCFKIDTTCVRPANHLGYVNRATVLVPMAFTAGLIDIGGGDPPLHCIPLPPNACPVATADNAVVNATVGSPASNDVDATDAEGDAFIFCLVPPSPGVVNSATGEWSYTPDCGDVPSFSVSIEATDKGCGGCAGNPPSVATFTVNVASAALSLPCSDVTVHWAAADASQVLQASGGCPPYTYSGTGRGTVSNTSPTAGLWTHNQDCPDVGPSSLETVIVTDVNGITAQCQFDYTVTNAAPVCKAIPPTLTPTGIQVCVSLVTAQGDADPLTYTLLPAVPPMVGWGESINGANEWCGTRPAGDNASHTVNYSVSDGCATVNCSFDVIFETPCIAVVMQGTDSSFACALNGSQATVCIVAQPGAVPGDAGGFDFLICFDQSGLSFLGATGGPEGWEYFTFRTGQFGGNCGGVCPDGFIRLVSIAEMNNGIPVDPADFNLDGKTLACLTFHITSDRTFIDMCLHVGFCSFDCTDNVISSKSGDTLWGATGGVSNGPNMPVECPDTEKGEFIPAIAFCPGAICVCRPLDDRGDLNLNGIANEIGDAVLYTNYFIYGSSVWNPVWSEIQILASDINADGIVLTVADLIYLIRIITGDEAPFPPLGGGPKLSPYVNSVDVTSDVSNGAVTVRTNSSVDLGAALLVFRYSGSVGAPVLANNSGMEIRSNAANGELRVLVFSSVEAAASRLTAGSNTLVTIPVGDGSIELVESQFSDYNGGLLSVNAASASLPTEYALLQNYPNPFNAGTIIAIQLTKQSDYSLTIFNVAGQVVRTFAGSGIGTVNVEWNGRNLNGEEAATGMYFYRVTTPEFTATKKMVLLK